MTELLPVLVSKEGGGPGDGGNKSHAAAHYSPWPAQRECDGRRRRERLARGRDGRRRARKGLEGGIGGKGPPPLAHVGEGSEIGAFTVRARPHLQGGDETDRRRLSKAVPPLNIRSSAHKEV